MNFMEDNERAKLLSVINDLIEIDFENDRYKFIENRINRIIVELEEIYRESDKNFL